MGFSVGDNFRKNNLSFTPGGKTVCVKENDEKVYEYDKIKFPYAYIKAIKRKNPDYECWIKEDK